VAANTLAAVTRAIGCVAAADLSTAIAGAAAVEIVGVGTASAAADTEAGGIAAAAAEAASVESVTVMSAAADVAAVAAVAPAAAALAAVAAAAAVAVDGTGAAVAIWPGLFSSFYPCLTSPPVPGLPLLISWLSFPLLCWGLELPAREGDCLHSSPGLPHQAGPAAFANTLLVNLLE
jgi:hypothetical protein